jgi:hypothetical protein
MCGIIQIHNSPLGWESISTVASHPDKLFPLTMDELMENPDIVDDRDSLASGLATLPESSKEDK